MSDVAQMKVHLQSMFVRRPTYNSAVEIHKLLHAFLTVFE